MSDSVSKTKNLISTLNRIQFIAEFFLFSKVSENSELIPQFLTAIEGIKFYFKSIAVSQSKNLYLENVNQPQPIKSPIEILETSRTTVDDQIERSKQLLQLIKKKPYQSMDHYAQMFQQLPCGKKMQLITSVQIPSELQSKKMSVKHILGELLSVLRPVISIISIRIFGIDSFKSYFVSFIIDMAIIFFFQKGLKTKNKEEKQQIAIRRREIIKRYLFRKPFYLLLKKMLIVPILAKIVKPERTISNLLISLFDMQSSITLTL